MNIVQCVSHEEVECFILKRDKDHKDPTEKAQHIKYLSSGNWNLVQLDEDEFFDLVFLQMDVNSECCWTKDITCKSRLLKNVASCALMVGLPDYPGKTRFENYFNDFHSLGNTFNQESSIILRRTKKLTNESEGTWYIVDGNGRCLAYAISLLKGTIYHPVYAYCNDYENV